MIPAFSISGTLPPFVGADATDGSGVSPYRSSASEFVLRLATTQDRAKLCEGFLKHRAALRAIGITQGIQWINGSFCEDVETTRGKPPADIDVVTLLVRPVTHLAVADFNALLNANLGLFDKSQTKVAYGCDAYFVDLNNPMHVVISQITYWFGLFTHQRATHMWKGIVEVPLASDDHVAQNVVQNTLNLPALPSP